MLISIITETQKTQVERFYRQGLPSVPLYFGDFSDAVGSFKGALMRLTRGVILFLIFLCN